MTEATHEQQALCQRFGSETVPVGPAEKLGIALATLTELPLIAVRCPPEEGTCGWYIYGGEHSNDPDFYQPLHVAHLEDYCPQILPYLALAPGWHVMLAPDYEDVWFEEGGMNATE